MADRYFTNFPEIQYQLADGKIVYIKDFFRKSKIEQEAVSAIVEYNLYNIPDGDRPDITATKLYGNPNLHWTFFLVNDIENYYDWVKDSQTFQRYIDKKYPGQYAIGSSSTDIVARKSNDADVTNKFLLGEKVTSVSSEGRVIEVNAENNRIAIEGGNFVADEAITGKVSTKSFTPTSVINQEDGVAYYKNGDLRKNHESSGYTSVSLYDDEYERNEAKRRIKIISPGIISNVVRRFEKVMTS
jgi:ribosomal protein L24